MTQFTDEQLVAALERTTAKLQAFYDALPTIERLMLDLAVDRIVAGERVDTRGYLTETPLRTRLREYSAVVRH